MSRDDLREKFENAEGEFADTDRTVALFQNVRMCAQAGVAPPQWVVQALAERIGPWLNLEVGSLDDAFGVNRYSETSLTSMKRNHRISLELFERVRGLEDQGVTIPWADLEKEFGASKTKLQTMYYKRLERFPKK